MVNVFLADGFEEAEALVTVDMLRRCGLCVKTVSITDNKTVTGAHDISVLADLTISEADLKDFDAVILPGGLPGSDYLAQSEEVKTALLNASQNSKIIAAICAAPKVLGKHGLLKGKNAVCYPGVESELIGANVGYERVCRDGNIITSRGAGTVYDFAFTIAAALGKEAEALKVREGILLDL